MGSDDREDPPQPSRQRGELPRLRIFRFPGGKPPGGGEDDAPGTGQSADSADSATDSTATDSTDSTDSTADSTDSTAADYAAPDDEPDVLDDSELADSDASSAEHLGAAEPDSSRTGGTRPIQVSRSPIPPTRSSGWDAGATAAAAPPPAVPPPVTPPPVTLPPTSSPGSPSPTASISPSGLPAPSGRRGRGPLIAGGVAVVLVLGILAWFLVGGLGDDEDDSPGNPKPDASAAGSSAAAEPVTPADWTKRVCAAVTAWNAETGDLPGKLTGLFEQGSDDLADSLADGYEALTDSAQSLSTGIGSAEAPEIDGSRPAAQKLTEMVGQVIDDVAEGRSDLTQMDDGDGPLSGPPAQELITEFGTIVDTPASTLREVIFNAEPELHDVFAANPSCADFV